MPDEDTNSGGVEPDVDAADVADDDTPLPDVQPEVDERGVPKRNVYAEYMRKVTKIAKKLEEQQAVLKQKDDLISDLQRRLTAPPPTAPQQPVKEEPKYTEAELVEGYAKAAGDPALQAVIVKQLIDLSKHETLTQTQNAQWVESVKNQFNQQAVQLFPELNDQTSPFYREVALALDRRVQLGQVGPSSIFDAANEVAARRPDLVKRSIGDNGAAPIRPRGFSEGGVGRPAKPKDDTPALDPAVFARYKQEYPGLSEASIKARAAEVNKRLLWK